MSFALDSAFIGGLKFLGLRGVGATSNTAYSSTIPHLAFMLFQGMFAVITPALIGAFVERIKFFSFSDFFYFMGCIGI